MKYGEYREAIEQYIDSHREELLQDLIRLCSIDSQRREAKEGMPFGEGVYKALQEAKGIAESYGFATKNYDNYVLAVDLNEKERALDILAHLDVVPEGEGWSVTKPFEPKVLEGKIYGRGTSDDKGPAMAAFYALRAVKDLGIELSKNVRLILGTDEECGSSCIKHYYAIEKEAPMSFSPDGEFPIVNIEKGRLEGHIVASFSEGDALPRLISLEAGTKINVVPPKARAVVEGFEKEILESIATEVEKEIGIRFELKGDTACWEIIAYGVNAHASLPDSGNNAITGLLYFLSKLPFAPAKNMDYVHSLVKLIPHGDISGEALEVSISDEKSGKLTLVLSLLKIAEGKLEGYFDLRAPVSAVPEYILKTLRDQFAAQEIDFLNTEMIAPHEVDEDSDFIQTLLSVYGSYTGLKPYTVAMGGGTYVHNVKNGVAFGAVFPGTDTKMHGADEFMVIDEMLTAAKIFAQSIIELCR